MLCTTAEIQWQLLLSHPPRVGVLLGHMRHRQFDARVAVDTDRLGLRDMRGAPEVKLILALADAQFGVAGRIGAGVKRAEPDFDAAQRRRRALLRDFDRRACVRALPRPRR